MSAAAPPVDGPVHVDLDAERALLGGVILGWTRANGREVVATLDAQVCYRAGHRHVVRAMHSLAAQGVDANLITLQAALRDAGTLDQAGGMAYVASLLDGVPAPTPAGLAWLVSRLQALDRARRTAIEVQRLQAMAIDRDAMSDGSFADQLGIVTGLVDAAPARARVLGPAEQWAALVEEATRDTSRTVPLSLAPADAVIGGGVRPGEVCGLMARPGIGKTLGLAQAATALASTGRGVLFFSLEMPGPQITARCVGMRFRQRPAQVWDHARDQRAAAEWATAAPGMRMCDASGLSVADMDGIVAAEPARPDLVVIDHLGLIGGDAKLSTYDRTSKQAREIKDLAKRRNVAVLLAIQVSREAGGVYGEKRLGLGSARDSGVIEEAVDYLLGIRRFDRVPTLNPGDRERLRDVLFLSVSKNRHGNVPDEEWPFAISPNGLNLIELEDCRPPDILDTGATFGGRRR